MTIADVARIVRDKRLGNKSAGALKLNVLLKQAKVLAGL